MDRPMMKCGHAAQARNQHNKLVCGVCIGIDPGATVIDDTPPDLKNREAVCVYGGHKNVPSSSDLPFFEHRPHRETDGYYCGCFGWD